MFNKIIAVAFLTIAAFLPVSSQSLVCKLSASDLPSFNRVKFGMTIAGHGDGDFTIGLGQGPGPLWPTPDENPLFEYQNVTFKGEKVIRVVNFHRPEVPSKPYSVVKAMTRRYSVPAAAWQFWDLDEQAIAYCSCFTIHITYATTTVSTNYNCEPES